MSGELIERLLEHSSYIRAFTEEGMSEIERQSMNAMADAAAELAALREQTALDAQRAALAERVRDSEIALRVDAGEEAKRLLALVEEAYKEGYSTGERSPGIENVTATFLHTNVAKALRNTRAAHSTPGSDVIGRLVGALNDTQATLSAVKAEATVDGGGTCVWIAETLHAQMVTIAVALASLPSAVKKP